MNKLLLIFLLVICSPAFYLCTGQQHLGCQFAQKFTAEELLNSPEQRHEFLTNVMYWEGHFHQPGIGYDAATGMTFDGHAINYDSGELYPPQHFWSAASKESIHLMSLTSALQGNPYAKIFINFTNPEHAEQTALTILGKKIQTLNDFNNKFPGFGGYLPWYYITQNGIVPANGWEDTVPGLDNGEMIWAIYALIYVLDEKILSSNEGDFIQIYQDLKSSYEDYFNLLVQNAKMMFYQSGGKIRAVTKIKDTKVKPFEGNYEPNCDCWLDDPYEGELFAFFLDLFSVWQNQSEREDIWYNKRTNLQAVEYMSPSGNAIVQRGWWFSSHEQWKYLELPYLDVPINRQVFLNGEQVRTWNSALKHIPGLFASVTNVTSSNSKDTGYLSAIGIPSIAFQPSQSQSVITPYASFPVVLANFNVGLVWYHHHLLGPKMQGPYGSTESISVDGKLIAPVLTWDSKITTVTSILGGVSSIVGSSLKKASKYDRFYQVVEREWSRVFPAKTKFDKIDLSGYGLPNVFIPHNMVPFSASC